MKKTIITAAILLSGLLCKAQSNFHFVYSNQSSTSPRISLYDGNYEEGSMSNIDTIYSIKDDLPLKTIRTKFKEPKPVDRWMVATVSYIWNDPTNSFAFYSCSVDRYVEYIPMRLYFDGTSQYPTFQQQPQPKKKK